MPRWVKTFLIVALVVVLLLVIFLLTSGGHGPGRHMSGGSVGGPADANEAARTVGVTTSTR
jgi:preprotein translocase subunit SecG